MEDGRAPLNIAAETGNRNRNLVMEARRTPYVLLQVKQVSALSQYRNSTLLGE